ncbi:MAG: hypothetical protein L0229_23420 [Blastocatellia bacterium]|nr:hypothetical protein [Blastocatellia bacterium]
MTRKNFGKLAFLLLALAILTLPIYPQSRGDMEETASFRDKTDSLKFDFRLSEEANSARLEVKVRMKSGRVEWRLRDPNGDVRLTGHGTGGSLVGTTGDMKSIAGVWTLDLRLTDATGDYKVNWRVR